MSESVDSLKQRLVGAFVILSLAVIFLPMLFDKPHREGNDAVELIPPKPQMATVVISKPKPIDVTMPESVKVLQQDAQSKAPKIVAANTQSKSLEKSGAQSVRKASATDAVKKTPVKRTQKADKPKVVAKQKPKAKSKGAGAKPKVYSNVWMVQLGTFSKAENAYALRDKLRESGVNGHTKKLNSGGALRVFAGPFVTKKEALRIKRKVDSQFKVKSLVVYFEA